MSRSFLSNMVRLQREAERAQRAHIREAERQERIMLRDARTRERENLAAFLADREAETQKANNDLAEKITDLQQILSSRIGQDPGLDFKKLFEVADEGASGPATPC